ncbi:unnamed protein product [Phytophthora fragariaefolia]|uniref:Unnamed protein product n=1 Tax=Phytophthora fragariaefolia TaxID=1490495 RepID=A0A9W6Y7A5_9STRA|nr:unnamed protein product [Phytophthora fragariaefolia]
MHKPVSGREGGTTRQGSVPEGLMTGTDGPTAPVEPWLMLSKPGHAKDQIVAIIHIQDIEQFGRVNFTCKGNNLACRHNGTSRLANASKALAYNALFLVTLAFVAKLKDAPESIRTVIGS